MDKMDCVHLPPLLKDISVMALQKTCFRFLSNLIENRELNELYLQTAMQSFRQLILTKIPPGLADEVYSALREVWIMQCHIHNVYETAHLLDEQNILLNQQTIAVIVLTTCVTNLMEMKITEFSVGDSDYVFGRPILQSLASMNQLRKLDLGKIDCKYFERVIIDSVRCLQNLEVFTCYGCTDAILCEISNNCTKLHSIVLRSSVLSRNSICSLAHCTNLKYMDLLFCLYPPESVAYLLTSLSSLEEIYVWKLDQVLQAVDIPKQKQNRVLKSLNDRISSEHLNKINELWPQVVKLDVEFRRGKCCIFEKPFSSLMHVVLRHLDFSDDNILSFLEKMPNVRHFELLTPMKMTEQSFCAVAKSLPYLETFILKTPNIKQFSQHGDYKQIVFHNLKFLEIALSKGDVHEIFFKIQYPNLKRFTVNNDNHVTSSTYEKFCDLKETNNCSELCEFFRPDSDLLERLEYTVNK